MGEQTDPLIRQGGEQFFFSPRFARSNIAKLYHSIKFYFGGADFFSTFFFLQAQQNGRPCRGYLSTQRFFTLQEVTSCLCLTSFYLRKVSEEGWREVPRRRAGGWQCAGYLH